MRLNNFPFSITKSNIEISLLIFVLFVYAGSGSPTPDGFSWSEVLQAAGLLFLVLIGLLSGNRKNQSFFFSIFLFSALFFGIASSSLNNNSQLFRDLIAHLFFCIPVLWARKLSDEEIKWVLLSLTFAGGIISFRFLSQSGFSFSALDESKIFSYDGFLKLNTDPLVTFSAGYGIIALLDNHRPLWLRVIILVFSSVSMMAIGFSALRGPMLIVLFVAIIAILNINFKRNWFRALFFLLLLFATIRNFDFFIIFSENFQSKMANDGGFAKWDEFLYVMNTASSDILYFLFGSGFGSSIDVGGRFLPFTHSAYAYYFAKTGFIVFMILILLNAEIFIRFFRSRKFLNPEVMLLFTIFLYGTVINPHYKYMTFGVVILLMIQRTTLAQRKGEPSQVHGLKQPIPVVQK
jgi:hypothetical protein